MRKHRLKFNLVALTFLAAVSTTHGAEEQANGEAPASILEYDRSPDAVVIEMRFWDLPGAVTPAPLQIYGDGTVIVSKPIDSPDRGVYESKLSESEMHDLLQYMEQCGMMSFNVREVAQRVNEIKEKRRTEAEAAGKPYESTEVVGGATVVIEISLTQYKSPESREILRDHRFKAKWYEPRFASEQYPEVTELASFADAVQYLNQLISDATASRDYH